MQEEHLRLKNSETKEILSGQQDILEPDKTEPLSDFSELLRHINDEDMIVVYACILSQKVISITLPHDDFSFSFRLFFVKLCLLSLKIKI